MKLATASLDCDRFDYVYGAWLFWSEHHEGMMSRGYQRLSFYDGTLKFNPGPLGGTWESLSESAREVYRAWCERESVECDYDKLRYVLEQADCFDLEDNCVEYFLDRYEHADPDESGLCNYDHSDFVNNDMPYTRDLLRFYNDNEESVLYWVDQYCEACGLTSRLQALEGQQIETPDEFATALVNCGMTYLAGELLRVARDD
jgi:hypothetical protein